jgi:hypothetical protein
MISTQSAREMPTLTDTQQELYDTLMARIEQTRAAAKARALRVLDDGLARIDERILAGLRVDIARLVQRLTP